LRRVGVQASESSRSASTRQSNEERQLSDQQPWTLRGGLSPEVPSVAARACDAFLPPIHDEVPQQFFTPRPGRRAACERGTAGRRVTCGFCRSSAGPGSPGAHGSGHLAVVLSRVNSRRGKGCRAWGPFGRTCCARRLPGTFTPGGPESVQGRRPAMLWLSFRLQRNVGGSGCENLPDGWFSVIRSFCNFPDLTGCCVSVCSGASPGG
jgi:hypothetical protein